MDEKAFEQYLKELQEYCLATYGLETDYVVNPERARQAFIAGDTQQEIADFYGEKHDLTKREDFELQQGKIKRYTH